VKLESQELSMKTLVVIKLDSFVKLNKDQVTIQVNLLQAIDGLLVQLVLLLHLISRLKFHVFKWWVLYIWVTNHLLNLIQDVVSHWNNGLECFITVDFQKKIWTLLIVMDQLWKLFLKKESLEILFSLVLPKLENI